MEIKISTLSENTSSRGYLAEWGLSMLVEAGGKKILFDTGAGYSTLHNAQLMGLDLAAVDSVVLSHGHYDHTGGLRDVLKRSGGKEVIAHPAIWEGKYADNGIAGHERHIGIPFSRDVLEALGASFKLSTGPVELAPGIITSGEIAMTTDFEPVDADLIIKDGGKVKKDSVPDDLALIIDADYGLVVIVGCAHRGIVNTLRHAQKLTGRDLIYAAIGGTHLMHASAERLEKTGAALLEMGVQYLGASHCTGFKASAYLSQLFGERFFLNNAGTRLTLPFQA
jgi:7,8-dihydropterin-6-yl-methyl-4-(beta-D-ribofuranosyl)aminobenzene 5'-phosphate synthase